MDSTNNVILPLTVMMRGEAEETILQILMVLSSEADITLDWLRVRAKHRTAALGKIKKKAVQLNAEKNSYEGLFKTRNHKLGMFLIRCYNFIIQD